MPCISESQSRSAEERYVEKRGREGEIAEILKGCTGMFVVEFGC